MRQRRNNSSFSWATANERAWLIYSWKSETSVSELWPAFSGYGELRTFAAKLMYMLIEPWEENDAKKHYGERTDS